MIFVCVGSREYQFNRLLVEIDKLIETKIINQEVFAQIGQSTYIPKNYKFQNFLSSTEFKQMQNNAELIISHAGTGALMGALKLGKNVIAVPRLEEYKEHTDDHQLQIASVLDEQNYLKSVTDIKKLGKAIDNMTQKDVVKEFNKESNILEVIINHIEKNNIY